MLVGDAVIGGSGAATICGADDSVGAANVIGAKADVCWAAGCIGGGGGANTGVGGMAIMPEDGGGVSCMDCGAGGGAEGCAAGDMRTAAGGGNAPVVSGRASSIEGSAAASRASDVFAVVAAARSRSSAARTFARRAAVLSCPVIAGRGGTEEKSGASLRLNTIGAIGAADETGAADIVFSIGTRRISGALTGAGNGDDAISCSACALTVASTGGNTGAILTGATGADMGSALATVIDCVLSMGTRRSPMTVL